MNNNILGRNIRKARLKKGWTQKQLAEAIGVKHNSISDWENGKSKPYADTRVSGFVLKPLFLFLGIGIVTFLVFTIKIIYCQSLNCFASDSVNLLSVKIKKIF